MNKKEEKFIKTIWHYWRNSGRHNLPWRKTTDPYNIFVSELMLQQTQVDRVLPKYEAFLEKYPNVKSLSAAKLSEVLSLWQGLGYNRRAKYLRDCAQAVVSDWGGKFPVKYEELRRLPGVGPYTAGAISAFAYNKPVPIIETNIRAVYIHHFFNDDTEVEDSELQKLICKTLEQKKVREWYWALMDYGSFLKRTNVNPNRKSKHYTLQSRFEGSDRQIRGAIIKEGTVGSFTRIQLHKRLPQFDVLRIDVQLKKLLQEGLLVKTKERYSLPT